MTTSTKQLIELYIATFGRAPDASGLVFWQGHLSDATLSLNQIAQLFFDATETIERYPSSLSYDSFVDEVYVNVLGRPAENEGRTYWVNRLEQGSITKDEFILSFVGSASSNEGTNDQLLVNNKTLIGEYFAITLGLDDTTLAFHVMDSLSLDINTLECIKADLLTFTKETDYIYKVLDDTNNTYNGSDAKDWIYGMLGDDTIDGGNGKNHIYGGGGSDTLYGGSDIDVIFGDTGDDILYGGDGDDIMNGGEGNDSIHGDAGINTIYGDSGDDYLYGGDDADTIYGGFGNDTIVSGLGNDRIYGEDGNDKIEASDGKNWVDAGGGDDIIYGGVDVDLIYGGSGDDTLYGFAGSDVLSGMNDADLIYGGEGDDVINGGDGADSLNGDAGNDVIYGEAGDDIITGGQGSDTLVGGAGRDKFQFSSLDSTLTSLDTITDFTFSLILGDYIQLQNNGVEVIITSKVNVATAASLSAALDLVSAEDGSVNAIIKWFVYQSNTYIVEDMSANVAYDPTIDLVVKLQGIYDLSTMDSSILSFA